MLVNILDRNSHSLFTVKNAELFVNEIVDVSDSEIFFMVSFDSKDLCTNVLLNCVATL